jgi:hypothetical protein
MGAPFVSVSILGLLLSGSRLRAAAGALFPPKGEEEKQCEIEAKGHLAAQSTSRCLPVRHDGRLMRSPRAPAPRRSRWPFLSLIPLGLGAWAPIYAGRRAGRPRWMAFGAIWTIAVIAGFVLSSSETGGTGGGLILFGWVAGAVYSFSVRREYEEIIRARGPSHAPGAAGGSGRAA